MEAVHCKIYGRVQGVGFRYFTRSLAKKFGIVGWVKNNPDGSVELVAKGDEDKINDFLTLIKNGPPLSYVTGFEKEKIPVESINRNNFEISY